MLLGPALLSLLLGGWPVVVIGTDSHKRTHTVVAVDGVGRKLAEKTVAATSDGHLALVQWAHEWPAAVFALEDCRHLTRRLERDLLTAGRRVVRVPTRLMAGGAAGRARARQVRPDRRRGGRARGATAAGPAGGAARRPYP